MMRRRSAEESKAFVSAPGSRWYQKRHGEVQADGTIVLVDDEKIDIQAQMNAEYPMTTIDNILANSLPTDYFGDDGSHGLDATKLPTTLAEFMQFQIDQRTRFDSLPADVRSKFGNDFNQFLASAGSEEWFTKLGIDMSAEKVDAAVPISKGQDEASVKKEGDN